MMKIKTIWDSEVTVELCYISQEAEADKLTELYTAISNASRKQVLIMEDMNFPKITWVTNENDTAGTELRDIKYFNNG